VRGTGVNLSLFEPVPIGRVLYVEDDPVNMLLVKQYLAQEPGLELIQATDGKEGLKLARRHRPDLVLLDMRLPDMDGFEWMTRTQADRRLRTLRCVALSASAMPDEVRRARALGVLDYWTKPIERETFMRGIARLLGISGATS